MRLARVAKHFDAPVWPRVHSLQVPAARVVPGLQQSMHAFLPPTGWYLLTAHFLQDDMPRPLEYWPLGQGLCDVLPVPAA